MAQHGIAERDRADRRWLFLLTRRCQRLVCRTIDTPPAYLLLELPGLVAAVPKAPTGLEQLVVNGLLLETLVRMVRAARIDHRADVTRWCMGLLCHETDFGGWCREWAGVAKRCTAIALAPYAKRERPRAVDRRVALILRAIETQFWDPNCDGTVVAKAANLSASYAARIVLKETGRSISAHLRSRRMLIARRLLAETAFTIKETSSHVGYAHESQFSRHFKRTYDLTPRDFRAGLKD